MTAYRITIEYRPNGQYDERKEWRTWGDATEEAGSFASMLTDAEKRFVQAKGEGLEVLACIPEAVQS